MLSFGEGDKKKQLLLLILLLRCCLFCFVLFIHKVRRLIAAGVTVAMGTDVSGGFELYLSVHCLLRNDR